MRDDRERFDDVSRRGFLKALGASLALAGLDGCTRMPAEKIIPFVTQPPELTPGIAVHYATAMLLDGYATGLIVEAHEGRPTKIEGNPDHPASLGASGALEQASLLQLYDPDRATRVRSGRSVSSWGQFAAAMSPASLRPRVGARGAGLAVLLESTSSPLVRDRLDALRSIYPAMQICFYTPLQSRSGDDAFMQRGLVPQYDIATADVILSAGSDFLAAGPFNLRYARKFADRRRTPLSGMNRLYVAESSYTVTGGAADHRLACGPAELERLLRQIHGATRGIPPSNVWAAAVAEDLQAHAGRSLVIAGERQPAAVHALAAALNDDLHNTGNTVWHSASPLLGAGDTTATIESLVAALQAKAVDTVLVIGGNPSYATPAALRFGELLRAAPNSVYVGLHENETAADCKWFIPAAHYLESWGDGRSYDGTYTLVQPLVQPLHGGKSATEVLSAFAGDASPDVHAALRKVAAQNGVGSDDAAWAAALARGFVPATGGSAAPRVTATPRAELLAPPSRESHDAVSDVDLVLERDARVHDGSFANNGWLQELPDPITKLTWDNAAEMSAATARRLGVETGDVVELRRGGAVLRMPALVVAGHADGVVTATLGYGRRGSERVAEGVGVNVAPLWPAVGSFITSAMVARAADAARHDFAITQSHWTMEGRDQAQSTTLAAYRAHHGERSAPVNPRRSLTIYDPPQRLDSPNQWAMTIDLGTCIGCSACVVACQAENNIPVVGQADVAKSREMHWLRIDRYLEHTPGGVQSVTQPMLCQQCENAPCEYVCPVGATDHSADGLNEMVYNRCVGTRFCSNNCPYKVRRFNWFDYNARLSDTEQMGKNPDVTVRERGVMEKCTFCVQRIREAEISAGVEGRTLRGDDVKTACQQSCPTNAIVFGSLSDASSEMMRRRAEPRTYRVLDELGTNPRIEYLARIRNLNPRLESAG